MRKQLPLLAASALALVLLAGFDVSYWWAYAAVGVIGSAQIARGLGLHKLLAGPPPKPYVPPAQRPAAVERREGYQRGPDWDERAARILAERQRSARDSE